MNEGSLAFKPKDKSQRIKSNIAASFTYITFLYILIPFVIIPLIKKCVKRTAKKHHSESQDEMIQDLEEA